MIVPTEAYRLSSLLLLLFWRRGRSSVRLRRRRRLRLQCTGPQLLIVQAAKRRRRKAEKQATVLSQFSPLLRGRLLLLLLLLLLFRFPQFHDPLTRSTSSYSYSSFLSFFSSSPICVQQIGSPTLPLLPHASNGCCGIYLHKEKMHSNLPAHLGLQVQT